jgi:hypothetical protein
VPKTTETCEETTVIRWDEKTLAVSQYDDGRYKSMFAFNFHGYTFGEGLQYLVEQYFEPLGDNRTKLTFRSRLLDKSDIRSGSIHNPSYAVNDTTYLYWQSIGYFFVEEETRKIFLKNLQNIKVGVESKLEGKPFQRLHAYENPAYGI